MPVTLWDLRVRGYRVHVVKFQFLFYVMQQLFQWSLTIRINSALAMLSVNYL